jgi:4-alpha-glucanotransferase
MRARSSGLLLPIFSLPSPFGIGDFGPGARRFVDLLEAAGQRVWQVLPLNPTEAGYGHSPYHSISCFALNPLLISPELLAEEGWVERAALKPGAGGSGERVDYERAAAFKRALLAEACRRFRRSLPDAGYERFCVENHDWLDDYALFSTLSARYASLPWNRWPAEARDARAADLRRLRRQLQDLVEERKVEQYLLFGQWQALKRYSRERSVLVFGDIPIYVPHHSADVWAHRRLFKLDRRHRPRAVSGVPPDYFSADGQLWGHPVYDWGAHRRTRFAWWLARTAHQLQVFDALRIDHFRGLVAYWEVAAGARTARRGRWVGVPTDDFFSALQRRFAALPLVAEDLGLITADVRETMRRYGFPGMRVLMFGFSGDSGENPNAPHNIPAACVVYTGTHDNNTARGWFDTEASAVEKHRLSLVVGRRATAREVAWELIRLALLSPARWAVTPVQDLLGLGGAARMNTPGRARGNWLWRLTARRLEALPVARLRELTTLFGRG